MTEKSGRGPLLNSMEIKISYRDLYLNNYFLLPAFSIIFSISCGLTRFIIVVKIHGKKALLEPAAFFLSVSLLEGLLFRVSSPSINPVTPAIHKLDGVVIWRRIFLSSLVE